MSYLTRSKKRAIGGHSGDAGNEQIKKNRKADKHSVPPHDQSNSSKEDKITNLSELKTTIIKTSIATELGNINHNVDVFNQDIQENREKFNDDTILTVDVGKKFPSVTESPEYRIVCKIGYGGFSIVWLVIDMKSKEFNVAKVFKYDYGISDEEINILQQTSDQPNIMRFYEHFYAPRCGKIGCVAIYEPLGKDLNMLMKEASKHGGLSVPVIKKVTKHVLMALKAIHDLKVIHSDIKPNNIATCVSQLSLRRELEKIVEFMKSGKNISPLRMVCKKDIEIDVNKVSKILEEELEKVSKLEIKDVTELIFKLIDFGNAMKEGTESPTGTFGFRPPEYFFGSPLFPSHDIWSLGVSIVVLFTNKRFLEYGNGRKIDEITALRNIFGMFSRRHFKNFKDLDGYKKKFTTRHYSSQKSKEQVKKFLQSKFNKLQMDGNDRMDLIDFLLEMLKTVPHERKSADELLSHRWLNFELDDNSNVKTDLTQKISEVSITQRSKTTAAITPVISLSSTSNSNGTSGILLDEQMRQENTLATAEPKHSKNGGEVTGKTKKATMKSLRYDSFIYKEDNGKYYLYHKYWKIRYCERDNLFVCPRCNKGIRFDLKIGFVMVSKTAWHKNYRCPLNSPAPEKGYKYCNEWITKEEVDRKRISLEDQGYKPMFYSDFPDLIDKKEAEINEFDDLCYDTSSVKSDDTQDTDLDETEEDSNKTISEFGSGESYYEDDDSYAPPKRGLAYGECRPDFTY